jgi:hypothetical protein
MLHACSISCRGARLEFALGKVARGLVVRAFSDAILDTSTPSGRLMFQMLGVFAEFERAMIRERVMARFSSSQLTTVVATIISTVVRAARARGLDNLVIACRRTSKRYNELFSLDAKREVRPGLRRQGDLRKAPWLSRSLRRRLGKRSPCTQ